MIKMTKRMAQLYQQRWKRVQETQNRELQILSMPLRFKQLCLLMDSFRIIQIDQNREKETNQVRQQWLALQKQKANGR